MALATYSDLVTAVADWLANPALNAKIPDMIVLAESEIRRRLHIDKDEARTTLSASSEFVNLPADFGGMRAIFLPGDRNYPLEQMAHNDMLQLYAGEASGRPRVFAIIDQKLRLAPAPNTATNIEIIYYRDLPALTALAPTNWLITGHPDLYLMATLMQAELYEWNDGRLPIMKGRVDEIFEQINADARRRQWGAAPIAPRSAPAQMRRVRI